jgi:subtilisin family serine protease
VVPQARTATRLGERGARRRLASVVAVALVAAGPSATALAAGPQDWPVADGGATGSPGLAAPGARSPQDRYVVAVRRRGDLSAVERSARASGARATGRYSSVLSGFAVQMSAGAAARLARRPGVTVVPDSVYRGSGIQTDAVWGLDRLDQRSLPLDRSYDRRGAGSGVSAYVVDSGVRADHVELAGRVAAGFDAVEGRSSDDCNGHGTHVAGTLGGRTVGVAERVLVVPVRVLDCSGAGRLSDVLEGLDFVARDHRPGQPAVANLSLGGSRNAVLDAAVAALVGDGVTVVVAAGNSGTAACDESPAAVSAVITVAATGPTDRAPDWSNDGSCVDVFAPGVGIRSAWHSSATATAAISGTSMAAPHVAGAAALVLEAEPEVPPATVWSRLRTAATVGAVPNPGPATPNRLLSVLETPVKAPGGVEDLRSRLAAAR